MARKFTEKDIGEPIHKPVRDRNTGVKWVDIRISNDAIRFIKSAVQMYEGDKDDTSNEELKREVRKMIHEVWKQLNPSGPEG